MNQTTKDRLLLFIKELGIGQGKFETSVGLSNGYVNKLKSSPSVEKLKMIVGAFPELNPNWLMTGEGEMLNKNVLEHSHSKEKNNTIRYYPNVNGSMGGVTFLDDPDETVCDIIVPGYYDCKFAINAYGDSMYPLIKSGQIVLLMEWKESFIDWGKIYLVVTRSGYRMLKRLFPSQNECCITCRSENEENTPPFDVEKEEIIKCYLVKGWICRDVI